MMNFLSTRTKKNFIYIFIIGGLMETITSIMRIFFHIQSTRDTAFLAQYTFHLRIHHGYVGLLLIIIALFIKKNYKVADFLIIVGGSLLLSDLVHHFIVLWFLYGSPEFDLTYPH
jgi:hypothetical protein